VAKARAEDRYIYKIAQVPVLSLNRTHEQRVLGWESQVSLVRSMKVQECTQALENTTLSSDATGLNSYMQEGAWSAVYQMYNLNWRSISLYIDVYSIIIYYHSTKPCMLAP